MGSRLMYNYWLCWIYIERVLVGSNLMKCRGDEVVSVLIL